MAYIGIVFFLDTLPSFVKSDSSMEGVYVVLVVNIQKFSAVLPSRKEVFKWLMETRRWAETEKLEV